MVFPSNVLDEGLKGFPTLGDPPFPAKCKDMAVAELRDAGFPRGSEKITMQEVEMYKEGSEAARIAASGIHFPGMGKDSDIEWVTVYCVEAALHGWKFRRAWYYWVAYTEDSSHAIPEEVAEELNKTFRKEVRVEGFAGGQNVRGNVAAYHIDTPRGFAELIRLLEKRRSERRKALGLEE